MPEDWAIKLNMRGRFQFDEGRSTVTVSVDGECVDNQCDMFWGFGDGNKFITFAHDFDGALWVRNTQQRGIYEFPRCGGALATGDVTRLLADGQSTHKQPFWRMRDNLGQGDRTNFEEITTAHNRDTWPVSIEVTNDMDAHQVTVRFVSESVTTECVYDDVFAPNTELIATISPDVGREERDDMKIHSVSVSSECDDGELDFEYVSTERFNGELMRIGWIKYSSCVEGWNAPTVNQDYSRDEIIELAQSAVTVKFLPSTDIPGQSETAEYAVTADYCSNPIYALNHGYGMSATVDETKNPTVVTGNADISNWIGDNADIWMPTGCHADEGFAPATLQEDVIYHACDNHKGLHYRSHCRQPRGDIMHPGCCWYNYKDDLEDIEGIALWLGFDVEGGDCTTGFGARQGSRGWLRASARRVKGSKSRANQGPPVFDGKSLVDSAPLFEIVVDSKDLLVAGLLIVNVVVCVVMAFMCMRSRQQSQSHKYKVVRLGAESEMEDMVGAVVQ